MNGKRSEKGGITVVELEGTWSEMGRQYGSLLENEIGDVYDSMLRQRLADHPHIKEEWDLLADNIYAAYPRNIREFFKGMSLETGIDIKTLAYINAVEYCVGVPACSGLAVWGDYTSGGLVFGRNYDYNSTFKKVGKDLVLAVFRPSDGSQPVLTVGYAGEIYAVNGLNGSRIFIELNNATPSGGEFLDLDMLFSTERLMGLLFEADSLEYCDRFFKSVVSNQSYIIGITDGKTAKGWEWDNVGAKPLPLIRDGLMTTTNYYQNPDWTFDTPTDSCCWSGRSRVANMIAMTEKSKGRIDGPEMMRIMETSLEDGGPLMEEETIYQLVYRPEEGILSVRIIGKGGWEDFDTAKLLGETAI